MKYDDTLLPFLELMRAELHANSAKGDRPGWLAMEPEIALLEIYWHTAKLSAAVKNNDAALIREHSADVANMAMMLLDVCGGLELAQSAPAGAKPEAQEHVATIWCSHGEIDDFESSPLAHPLPDGEHKLYLAPAARSAEADAATAIERLLTCMKLAGWENDDSAIYARKVLAALHSTPASGEGAV